MYVANSSHRAAVPLYMGRAGFEGFLDLREKIFFLSRDSWGLSSQCRSSFFSKRGLVLRGEAQYKSVGAQAPPPIPEFLQVQ
jgi:hypothetical protein